MPTDLAGASAVSRRHAFAQRGEQAEQRTLRISDDGEPADTGNVIRRPMDFAAGSHHAGGIGISVGDADIADPGGAAPAARTGAGRAMIPPTGNSPAWTIM